MILYSIYYLNSNHSVSTETTTTGQLMSSILLYGYGVVWCIVCDMYYVWICIKLKYFSIKNQRYICDCLLSIVHRLSTCLRWVFTLFQYMMRFKRQGIILMMRISCTCLRWELWGCWVVWVVDWRWTRIPWNHHIPLIHQSLVYLMLNRHETILSHVHLSFYTNIFIVCFYVYQYQLKIYFIIDISYFWNWFCVRY